MITCSECLTGLSTSRLSDIRPGSPVAMHYAGCERCLAIVHDIQAAERGLGAALDQFGPSSDPETIAGHAADKTFRRRRRIARVFRTALAIVGLMLFAAAFEALRENDAPPPTEAVPAEPAVPSEPGTPSAPAAPAAPSGQLDRGETG
ncbi:MAG: hypothetical protein ACSLFK_17405 [Gemmatimonadaceae bacterium]